MFCLPACVQVASMLGTLLMGACSLLLLVFSNHVDRLFTSDPAVQQLATVTMLPLAVSLIGKSHRQVLCGTGCCSRLRSAAVQCQTALTASQPSMLDGTPPHCGLCTSCLRTAAGAQQLQASLAAGISTDSRVDSSLLSQTWMGLVPARRLSSCVCSLGVARRRGRQHCPGWSDAWLWASAAGCSSKPADILGAGPAVCLPSRLQTADGRSGAVGWANWHCWTASPSQLLYHLQVWCLE